ncbi:hypothetical protein GE061_011205 [Apolygus lucorum]|uniref:Uncharacterized protein n=1 Tax=Apolygus lucorum TaxID=248454 RepID=A0A8S9Y0T0_APOLU|nr:hypothetical protein GE061_011205 [Apolygus lucorum]
MAVSSLLLKSSSFRESEEAIIGHCSDLEALVGRLEAVTTRLEEVLSQANVLGLHEISLDLYRRQGNPD